MNSFKFRCFKYMTKVVFHPIEYSGAAEPQFRCGVSHLSGTTEPPFSKLGYSLNFLSNPYTSRMEISLDGSMLSILILYAS